MNNQYHQVQQSLLLLSDNDQSCAEKTLHTVFANILIFSLLLQNASSLVVFALATSCTRNTFLLNFTPIIVKTTFLFVASKILFKVFGFC